MRRALEEESDRVLAAGNSTNIVEEAIEETREAIIEQGIPRQYNPASDKDLGWADRLNEYIFPGKDVSKIAYALGQHSAPAAIHALRGNYWSAAANVGAALAGPAVGVPLAIAGFMMDSRAHTNARQKALDKEMEDEKKLNEQRAEAARREQLTTNEMIEQMRRSTPMPNTSTMSMKYMQGKFGHNMDQSFQPRNIAEQLPMPYEKRYIQGLTRGKRAVEDQHQRGQRGVPLAQRRDFKLFRRARNVLPGSHIRTARQLYE